MFLSSGDRNLGVAFKVHMESQASFLVEAKNSALLSSETGMSGNFLISIKGVKYHFEFQEGTWD